MYIDWERNMLLSGKRVRKIDRRKVDRPKSSTWKHFDTRGDHLFSKFVTQLCSVTGKMQRKNVVDSTGTLYRSSGQTLVYSSKTVTQNV